MKTRLLAIVLLLAGMAFGQYTPPSQDAYLGDNSVSCSNTATAFSIATVSTRKMFCTPAGHGLFSRGPFLFDPTATTPDETGNGYQAYVTAKFGGNSQWVLPNLNQLKALGWNSIPAYAYAQAFPYNASVKVPFVLYSNIAFYSTDNHFGYGTCAEKDMFYSMGRSGRASKWGGFINGSGLRDFRDPCWAAYYTAFLANNDAFQPVATASLATKGYVLGVSDSDSDNMHGFGAGPDFAAYNGNNDFRLGYVAFFVTPVQFSDSQWAQKYTDGTMYFKKRWHDLAIAAHTNIAGINAAWGSSYTTDKTSGTCFGTLQPTYICPSPSAAIAVGTTNGSAQTLTIAIPNVVVSPYSLYIAVGGTIVAGDNGNGTIYGPNVSGSINYTSGNGSVTLPAQAAGQAVTAGYIQNGFTIGTGMLDEDCRTAHAAYCGDGTFNTTIQLTGIPAAVQADINALTQDQVSFYTSTANGLVQNWAHSVASPAFVGHLNYFGTTAFATWGVPSDRYVLAGACGNIDAYMFGMAAGFDLTQAKLDYIDTYCPGLPVIDTSYRTANQQSVFSWAGASCTHSGNTITCTSSTPNKWAAIAGNYHLDADCSAADYKASNVGFSATSTTVTYTGSGVTSASASCNLFIDDQGQVNGFSSQAAKGSDYQTNTTAAISMKYTASNVFPLVGSYWWAWHDDWAEGLNWGVQTIRGNLYNGLENVNPVVACQAPNAAFNCGGELSVHNPPLGNVVQYIQATNTTLDSVLAGTTPPPPPPPPPTGTVTMTPTTLLYSSTPIGQTVSQTFTVASTLNVSTTILSQTVTGTGFTLNPANSTCVVGMVLTSNTQCTISVVFAPTAVASYTGNLSVVLTNTTVSSTFSGSGSTSIFFSTLLSSLTNPNTSPCNSTSLASYCGFAFPGWSDNRSLSVAVLTNPFDAAPLNIAKGRGTASDVHRLTTNTAPIFAHTQFWFTNNGTGTTVRDGVTYPYDGSHLKNGETSNNQAYIQAMLQDLYDRGYDGILGNWKGGPDDCGYPAFNSTCTNSTTVPRNSAYIKAITTMATTFPALRLGLVYDASAFNGSENCSTADANQPNCIQRKIDADLDYATTQYFASNQYLDDSTGKPVVLFFVDESGYLSQCTSPTPCGLVSGTTCNSQTSCWTAIYNGINSHMTNAGHPISMVFENSGGFTHTQSAGSFGWTQPPNVSNAGITVATQENWTGGTYLDNWYAASASNPSSLAFAPVYKGFDSENAAWYYPTGRIIAQQCGQVWVNSFAKANGKTTVDFLQVSTWDDYEEGTEVESGIDNCYSAPTLSLAGNILTITKHPTDATYSSLTTVQSLKVWATQDGTNWGLLATLPPATASIDLSTYPQLGIGSYQVRVQQVGMPGIATQMSAAVSNSSTNVIGPGKRRGQSKGHGALIQR